MPKLLTPEELAEMVEDLGSMALHLCNADDLLATIQAGHRTRALLVEIEHQADPGRNYTDPKTGETFISLPISVLNDIDTALKG